MTEDENDKEKEDIIKIVIIGESSVGKTSIINQFMDKVFEEKIMSTSGGSYNTKSVKCGSKIYKLEIWDTAGQERYRCMTKIFYKDADIALLVYDITNKNSFDELKNYWIKQVLDSSPKNIMLVIVANKHDLIDKKEIDDDIGKNFAKEINADFYMISAKIFNAVKEMFMDLVKKYTSGNHASFADDTNNSLDFKRIRKESVKSVKISRKKSVKKVKHKCC